MEDQAGNEYLIIEYLDELEESLYQANEHGMNEEIVKEIEKLHGDFVDLGNMAETKEQFKRLKDDVDVLVREMVKTCEDNDEGGARRSLDQLKDKVHTLMSLWGNK